MAKKDIKKYWVIERKYERSNEKKLLAMLDSRKSTKSVIEAMRDAMITDATDLDSKLYYKNIKKDSSYYPKRYHKVYPFLLAGNPFARKAKYKAWVTELNIKTGEYIDFDTKFCDFIKRIEKIHGKDFVKDCNLL